MGSFHFGGIERMVNDLAISQVRHKHDVCVCVGKDQGEFKDNFLNDNLRKHVLNLKSGFSISLSKFSQLKSEFRSFEIIHLHEFHLLVVLAAIFSKTKIIYTEHGNFGFGRPKKKTDSINFFLRRMFFKCSRVKICANSKFTKNYLEKNFYSGERLSVIYNGVDLNKTINELLFQELKAKFQSQFIVGTSSRLAGFKKIDRLIKVFNEFQKGKVDVVLLIVGEGPEKSKLIKLTESLGIGEKVHFLGFQSEISTYQQFFDVCIFPSEYEPFGLVAVECINLGKPVLIFKNGGGLVEIVEKYKKENICLDEQEMISRMTYFYENNSEDDEVEIINHFSVEKMYQDYLKCYNN
jgi:glycosyltransferase involved in cell wall biosynthesis